MYVHACTDTTTAIKGDEFTGKFAFGLDRRTFSLLVGGYGATAIGPMMWAHLKVYRRSKFHPIIKQRRQILLGLKDPVTQTQKAVKLLL